MKKQTIFSALITICFMLIFPITAQAAEVWDGSVDIDWYNSADTSFTITTAEQLAGLAQLVNDHEAVLTDDFEGKTITLASDIDLGGSATPWTPIAYGDSSNVVFRGVFDGAGYKITGLYINTTNEIYSYPVGFFGKSSSESTIKNLNVDGSVTGIGYNNGAGGVVGLAFGRVVGCSSSATVTAAGDNGHAGGIVGFATSSGNYIINCYNTGDISATGKNGNAGGIVGRTNNALAITNCYNSGSVSANDAASNVGGIVGYNSVSTATITNCYNIGELDGAGDVGGVVGDNTGVVKNSYYLTAKGAEAGIGLNSGTAGNVGTFTSVDSEITIEDTADNSISTGSLLTALNEGATAYNATAPTVYALEWTIKGDVNNGYPVLATYWANYATKPNNGQITSAEELAWLINNYDAGTYTLTKDIDLSAHMWTAIGVTPNEFVGTFDGAGHEITGLYIHAPTKNYQGLFGHVGAAGSVKNVGVSGSVTANNYVGGVAGRSDGTITDSHNTGTILATGSYAYGGGVVGYNEGAVSNSYNSGEILANNSSSRVGGVVGYNYSGTVTNSYNTGDISATEQSSRVGGVVGYNTGTVSNCHNTGNILATNSDSYIGGVVGLNYSSSTVTNSYNNGIISATGESSRVGGVVGHNEGAVSNSYNTGTITANGNGSDVSGVAGSNAGSIANSYNSGNISATGGYADVGGVVGDNRADGTVTNSYNSGNISATGVNSDVGGVVGPNYSSSTVTNCYYLKSSSISVGVGYNSGGTLTNIGSFSSADSEITIDSGVTSTDSIPNTNILDALNAGANMYNTANPDAVQAVLWIPGKIADGDYPVHIAYWVNYAIAPTTGDGSLESPYQIASAEEFAWMAKEVNAGRGTANYTLTKDIDLSGRIWTAMGSEYNINFTGIFDGGNNKITGLYINAPTEDYQGLFGYLGSGGVVKNVSVSGSVTGETHVAGVVAYNHGGSITNCHNSSKIVSEGTTPRVGGISGYSRSTGSITSCSNSGSISVTGSGGNVGGVVGGSANDSTITNCHNSGDILTEGDRVEVGGVVGITPGIVTNSYNTGTITTNGDYSNVGGVVGRNIINTTLANNYNIGDISATGDSSNVGGVAGSNAGSITNNYNSGNISITGYASNVGGVGGINNGTVTNSYNSGILSATGYASNVGGVGGINNGTVTNSYNSGIISATGDASDVGGVVGHNDSGSTVTNSYYKKGTSLKAIGYIRSGTVKNVGAFESPTSEITIEGTADENIPTTDLLTALIAGAKAHNETAPDGLKAYRWEMVSQDSYPTLTTERKFGDTNGDWEIDKDDLTAIAGNSYNTVATPETDNLDVNGDGVINFLDLAVVRNSRYFGK